MKPSAHHVEDKLLEFAYGELGSTEAQAVEAHVKGCTRCADELDEIRGVRRVMGKLDPEVSPTQGLDSIMAYAEQAARRAVEERRRNHWWMKPWIPALALGALCATVVVVVNVTPAQKNEVPAMELAAAPPMETAPEEEFEAKKGIAVPPAADAVAEKRQEKPAKVPGIGNRLSKRAEAAKDDALVQAKKKEYVSESIGAGSASLDDAELDQASSFGLGGSRAAPAPKVYAEPAPVMERASPSKALRASEGAPAPQVSVEPPGAMDAASQSTNRLPSSEVQTYGKKASAPVDRREEVRQLRKAISDGASGAALADLLVRLCDAEMALGNTTQAQAACVRVMNEFPDSVPARSAERALFRMGKQR